MKKTRIYLKYPWFVKDSTYHKGLGGMSSRNIEFINSKEYRGAITRKEFFWFSNFLKRNIRRTASSLKISIPNAHLSKKGDYDLIHCAHCLSLNEDKPWVADIESEWQFYVGNKNNYAKRKVKKILMKENCKKIMPWTEYTKNEILKEYPEVADKVEVVYPAVPVIKNLKKKKNKKIYLFFSGRYFYFKGGLHALETIDRLTKKYKEVYGIFNSEIPKEIFDKYKGNKKIKFYGLIPQKEVFELYNKSDIFIYPGYSDTFGFAFLEAMSFGVPIVSTSFENIGSRKEIVENGKTGFIFDVDEEINLKEIGELEEDIIRKLVENTEKLITDKNLRERMSKSCLSEIKNGKFSIKRRNKQLERIYLGAVRR